MKLLYFRVSEFLIVSLTRWNKIKCIIVILEYCSPSRRYRSWIVVKNNHLQCLQNGDHLLLDGANPAIACVS
jgi:hypothetical protein